MRSARSMPVISGSIALAWLVAIVAESTGVAHLVHHDALAESALPLWIALGLFVVVWQAMIVAMMLPSSLPLVRLYSVTVAAQPSPASLMLLFLGGYGAVWTAFGAAAFLGDMTLHYMVDRAPWLEAHAWLISGGIVATAGAFQFSPLKDECLRKCRLPATFLLQHYRRGAAAAFRLGFGHGLYCLGCCWALMLLMFAAGFANLGWMAALTALMVYEKTGRHGRAIVPYVGAALLAWSAVIFAHPSWLPRFLAGI